MRILDCDDTRVEALAGRTVGIVGFGNQGRAHALNLRDSGVTVVVGQRPGASFDRAAADGFEVLGVSAAVTRSDLLVVTLPDEMAAEVYAEHIAPALSTGKALGFVHGFNIRFGLIDPPPGVDVIMVAPKGPGTLLRSLYVQGKGLPALLAVERDCGGSAQGLALAWAAGIGSGRAGVVETSFAAETETDLFGEQVVLCGGVTALCKAAFETLVESGYEPEFAYLECVHELKQIVDLIYESGLTAMRARISNTAEYGDLTRGPRLINEQTRKEMKRILAQIRGGEFAREWIAEYRSGLKHFHRLHDADADTDFERAGQAVRKLMPWLPEAT
ncbi:MAG: ketol-acid reductoisomerase [Planctomycetota bacterium]